MNNRFSELFIRRPVATILLTIGIVFGGLLGYSQLPVSPLPQVDCPVISVQANMPGASPDTMATSVAAIFGALPLMLGTGVGSELRRPLGLAIVGGLAFSQVLTLYTTPVIYLFFERLGERLGMGSTHSGATLATETP